MATDPQERLRRQLLEMMLDKVEEDTYPSTTMLDIIERLLTPDDVEDYTGVLMGKIRADTYPSSSLVNRLLALT